MVSYYTLYTHEQAVLLPRLARRGFAPGTYLSSDLDWVIEDALYEEELEGEPHVVMELKVLEDFLVVPSEDISNAILGTEEEEEYEEVVEEAEEGEEGEEEEPDWELVQRRLRELEEERQELESDKAGFEADEEWDLVAEIEQDLADNAAEYIAVAEGQVAPYDEPEEQEEAQYETREADVEAGELPAGIRAEDWPQTMGEAIKLTETATLVHRLPASEAKVLGVPQELVVEELTVEEAAEEAWYRFNLEKPEPLLAFKAPLWKRILQRFIPGSRG